MKIDDKKVLRNFRKVLKIIRIVIILIVITPMLFIFMNSSRNRYVENLSVSKKNISIKIL